MKEEKKLGNPVAGLIDKLYLERNCMTLLLSNNLDDMDDDEKTLPVDKVLLQCKQALQPIGIHAKSERLDTFLHYALSMVNFNSYMLFYFCT